MQKLDNVNICELNAENIQDELEVELKQLELENDRLEKRINLYHARELSEMDTRHQLARFLIFCVCPAWLIAMVAILIVAGAGLINLPVEVLTALVVANPVGIGGLVFIVIKFVLPDRQKNHHAPKNSN